MYNETFKKEDLYNIYQLFITLKYSTLTAAIREYYNINDISKLSKVKYRIKQNFPNYVIDRINFIKHNGAKCKQCKEIKSLNNFFYSKHTRYRYFNISKKCKQCVYNESYFYKMKFRKKYGYSNEMNKRKNNVNILIGNRLRQRINQTLKNNIKSKSTMKLLGCFIEEFKNHLQQTAIDNGYLDFDIHNYSGQEYHIDHIKPCSMFDLSKPEEQEKCFHYTNMQILSAEDNLKKSNKYEELNE